MECPKCGHQQEQDFECFRCGIIFSKYQPDEAASSLKSIQAVSISYYDTARERKQVLLLMILLLVLGFVLYRSWADRPIQHSPGILVSEAPDQIIIQQPSTWRKGNRVIVPLARFHMRGRVLSIESYRWDNSSDLSPIDVALGWGPMSDQRVLDALDIAQGSRRYMLTTNGKQLPVPIPVLMANSANMHMIPAEPDVEKQLKALRIGQVLELAGFLVGIQQDGRWIWVSSLSRTDTGDGSCEVVWVERLRVE